MTVPEASPYEAQLVAQVTESLSMHLMDNARFMAERLHAEFPTEARTSGHAHPCHSQPMRSTSLARLPV
jgi:hypothetical protein